MKKKRHERVYVDKVQLGEFGLWLRAHRERRQLTQEAAADLTQPADRKTSLDEARRIKSLERCIAGAEKLLEELPKKNEEAFSKAQARGDIKVEIRENMLKSARSYESTVRRQLRNAQYKLGQANDELADVKKRIADLSSGNLLSADLREHYDAAAREQLQQQKAVHASKRKIFSALRRKVKAEEQLRLAKEHSDASETREKKKAECLIEAVRNRLEESKTTLLWLRSQPYRALQKPKIDVDKKPSNARHIANLSPRQWKRIESGQCRRLSEDVLITVVRAISTQQNYFTNTAEARAILDPETAWNDAKEIIIQPVAETDSPPDYIIKLEQSLNDFRVLPALRCRMIVTFFNSVLGLEIQNYTQREQLDYHFYEDVEDSRSTDDAADDKGRDQIWWQTRSRGKVMQGTRRRASASAYAEAFGLWLATMRKQRIVAVPVRRKKRQPTEGSTPETLSEEALLTEWRVKGIHSKEYRLQSMTQREAAAQTKEIENFVIDGSHVNEAHIVEKAGQRAGGSLGRKFSLRTWQRLESGEINLLALPEAPNRAGTHQHRKHKHPHALTLEAAIKVISLPGAYEYNISIARALLDPRHVIAEADEIARSLPAGKHPVQYLRREQYASFVQFLPQEQVLIERFFELHPDARILLLRCINRALGLGDVKIANGLGEDNAQPVLT